jgi:hypothetical protein
VAVGQADADDLVALLKRDGDDAGGPRRRVRIRSVFLMMPRRVAKT